MIDRGALVLGPFAAGPYRGVHRPPLDAQNLPGPSGRDLRRAYAAAIVEGDGVIEDLDQALAFQQQAERIGMRGLDVVVFERPSEPPPGGRILPIAVVPPAEGLHLLGYDVIEPIEPYWSPLAVACPPIPVNEYGLLATRADAERWARELNEQQTYDEPLVAVRVWIAEALKHK